MKHIGFKNLDIFHLLTDTNLKRDLLYFDEIFIDEQNFNVFVKKLDEVKSFGKEEHGTFVLNDILFLNKEGCIKIEDSRKYFLNSIPHEEVTLADVDARSLFDEMTHTDSQIEWSLRFTHLWTLISNAQIRRTCSLLNENNIFNVKPILEIRTFKDYSLPPSEQTDKAMTRKHDVLTVALNKIPIPDDTVSWEQILDFKNNPNSKLDRLALISWISEIGNSSLTPYEIEQKMEYLIASYEEELRINKLKYRVGTIELIVTTPLKILENIVTLNWSKAAKVLFDLKKINVDLLIGETKAAGREVAYISRVQELVSKS